MIVGVPRESFPGERRVALIPATVPSLTKAGLEVIVETGAGEEAGFFNEEYEAKGARIAGSRAELFDAADVVFQVRALGANPDEGKADLELMKSGQIVVGACDPLGNPAAAKDLAGTQARSPGRGCPAR